MALLVFGVWEAVPEVLGYEVTFWVNESDFFDVDKLGNRTPGYMW